MSANFQKVYEQADIHNLFMIEVMGLTWVFYGNDSVELQEGVYCLYNFGQHFYEL